MAPDQVQKNDLLPTVINSVNLSSHKQRMGILPWDWGRLKLLSKSTHSHNSKKSAGPTLIPLKIPNNFFEHTQADNYRNVYAAARYKPFLISSKMSGLLGGQPSPLTAFTPNALFSVVENHVYVSARCATALAHGILRTGTSSATATASHIWRTVTSIAPLALNSSQALFSEPVALRGAGYLCCLARARAARPWREY